jgi:hypothetical protein
MRNPDGDRPTFPVPLDFQGFTPIWKIEDKVVPNTPLIDMISFFANINYV